MEPKKTVFFLLLVSSPVASLTKEKEEDGGEYFKIKFKIRQANAVGRKTSVPIIVTTLTAM